MASGLLTLLTLATPLFGHPYHTSIGEADWNPETQRLEVALRFVPDDLERALTVHFGALSKDAPSEETDRRIIRWLEAGFRVLPSDSQGPAPIEWIGKEVSIQHIWLYFQVPLAKGLEEASLEHRLLLDLEPDQTNTLLLRQGEDRTTLTFTREHFRHPLRTDQRTSSP